MIHSPYYVLRDGELFCTLCEKWATDNHVLCQKHKNKVYWYHRQVHQSTYQVEGPSCSSQDGRGSALVAVPSPAGSVRTGVSQQFPDQPWIVERIYDPVTATSFPFCELCDKWADENHLASDKHMRRADYPESYGYKPRQLAITPRSAKAPRLASLSGQAPDPPSGWTQHSDPGRGNTYYPQRSSTQQPLLTFHQEARTSTEQALHPTIPSAFPMWQNHPLIMVLSDSTLLLHSETHVCVDDEDRRPLGDIVGKYGGCFDNNDFQDVRQTIIDTVSGNIRRFGMPGPRLRVGYVPAANCHPKHKFPVHQAAQSEVFRDGWIATPTLEDLSKTCVRETGKPMYKSKGVHCTEPGRLWLQRYLFRWGKYERVSLIFCVGWNGNAAREYRLQVDLVNDLQKSLTPPRLG